MSERGSFVTEYIYCNNCFEALKKILLHNDKHFCSQTINSWENNVKELPIIAGKLGGLYSGEEIVSFEMDIEPQIAKVICHPLRIAILAEDGEKILYIKPIKDE